MASRSLALSDSADSALDQVSSLDASSCCRRSTWSTSGLVASGTFAAISAYWASLS